MKLSEFIRQLEDLTAQMAGDDPEVILFDKTAGETYRVDPERNDEYGFQFEILRGEDEIVIEF